MNQFLTAAILFFSLIFNAAYSEDGRNGLGIKKIVDLTQPLYSGMPFWPGTEPISIQRLADYDVGYRMHKFTMWENIGTHIDSPSHFIAGKRTIDQLPLEQLIAPIALINVQDKVSENEDYELSRQDILDWENVNGKITAGSLVIMNTGWYKRFTNPQKYINQDTNGTLHFPGFSPESAELLLTRGIAGIGIDTMSLDPGNDLGFPVHKIILSANKYQVENMNNLDSLPTTGAVAVIGVLPVKGGSQAQARIFALIK